MSASCSWCFMLLTQSSSALGDSPLQSNQELCKFDQSRNNTQSSNCEQICKYESLRLEFPGQPDVWLGLQEDEDKGSPEEEAIRHNTVQVLDTGSEDHEREAVEKSENGDEDPQSLVLVNSQERCESDHD